MATHGRSLGQTWWVENTPGRGSIAVGRVVRAAPDGYMLSIATSARTSSAARPTATVRSAQGPRTGGDARTNRRSWFRPRFRPGIQDSLLGQRGIRTRYRSVPAVRVRRRMSAPSTSRKLTGTQSADHSLSRRRAGNAGLFCRVHRIYSIRRVCRAEFRAGRVKPYAVTAKTRLSAGARYSDGDEAGLPGFLYGVCTPSGRPGRRRKDVVGRLNSAITKRCRSWRCASAWKIWPEIPPREQQTPEALGAHHSRRSKSGGHSSRRLDKSE